MLLLARPFVYFIVLKVVATLYFAHGLNVLAAACIAIAMALVEFAGVRLVERGASQDPLTMLQLRSGDVTWRYFAGMFGPAILIGIVVATGAAYAIVFAFDQSTYDFEFAHLYGDSRQPWRAWALLFAMVGAPLAASGFLTAWLFSQWARR